MATRLINASGHGPSSVRDFRNLQERSGPKGEGLGPQSLPQDGKDDRRRGDKGREIAGRDPKKIRMTGACVIVNWNRRIKIGCVSPTNKRGISVLN